MAVGQREDGSSTSALVAPKGQNETMKETVNLPAQSPQSPTSSAAAAEVPKPKLKLVKERVHMEFIAHRDAQKTSDWEISI